MALVKCKECGSAVSTRAEKCPQCGNPLKTSSSRRIFLILIILLIGALGYAFVWLPIARYQTAKQECFARISQANHDADYGRFENLDERYREADLIMIGVLQSKPFGLPLTAQEKKSLTNAKNSIRNDVIKRLKLAFTDYKNEHQNYPEGTNAEIIKTLETEYSKLDLHYFWSLGDTEKNAKGELIDPFGNPYPMNLDQLEAILPSKSEN